MSTLRYDSFFDLIDNKEQVIATIVASTKDGSKYEGTIRIINLAPEIHRLFLEFEEIVSQQVFSLLDSIEEKIKKLEFKVQNQTDGTIYNVQDLQIWKDDCVSFIIES